MKSLISHTVFGKKIHNCHASWDTLYIAYHQHENLLMIITVEMHLKKGFLKYRFLILYKQNPLKIFKTKIF